MQGSYIRVGDADKPMTEYEVYSYEAFRKKYRDDIRPVEQVRVQNLDQDRLAQYVLRRKQDRPHFATLELSRLYDLIGVTKNGVVTLAAVLLFSPYPQAYFPQLSIIGTHVPGTEMGLLDEQGRRFIDSKRLEGTLPEMLEQAVGVVRNNMQVSTRIDPATGRRIDRPEYPLDAVRETILNALVHRDYSIHTEGMPIRLTMYSDRLEVANPGGLYGRLTVDQLGKVQPDTPQSCVGDCDGISGADGKPIFRHSPHPARDGGVRATSTGVRQHAQRFFCDAAKQRGCDTATSSRTIPGSSAQGPERIACVLPSAAEPCRDRCLPWYTVSAICSAPLSGPVGGGRGGPAFAA